MCNNTLKLLSLLTTTQLLLLSVFAQGPSPNTTITILPDTTKTYTAVTQAFTQLQNLTRQPPDVDGRPKDVRLGGQDFNHCCLLAVNESLTLNSSGYVIPIPGTYIYTASGSNDPTSAINALFEARDTGQFPCGARYNGNDSGTPAIIKVPYLWLDANCPGWQLSDSKNGDEAEWLSPFTGFLLPAVVFCITIPRRRKLGVWNKLFVQDMSLIGAWILAPFAALAACVVVVTDTIIWLCMCFIFAGPMLVSGLMEAYLDKAMLEFVAERIFYGRLTLDMKTRIMFVILVGNLDLDLGKLPTDMDIELVEPRRVIREEEPQWIDGNGVAINRRGMSPWTHVENMIYPLRTYRDSTTGVPRQHPFHHKTTCQDPNCSDANCVEVPIKWDDHTLKEVKRMKTRLRTMLACQYSFGATVGAPVVFFLGSFAYSIVTTLSDLGDESSSLALAFGMWYMIIPHLSIVSGLLLAGNNPNTLEAVVALEYEDDKEIATHPRESFGKRLFELAYESRYRPQWLWLRGPSKRQWALQVCDTFQNQPLDAQGKIFDNKDVNDLRRTVTMSPLEWLYVLGMALILLGIPYLLAFLTGYFTPQIGFSCRSLTFTAYFLSQCHLVILGLWAYGTTCEEGFFNPLETKTWFDPVKRWTLPSLWAALWYIQFVGCVVTAIFSSVGGTMMQLMGVYSADVCDVNIPWTGRHLREQSYIISTNYQLELTDAKHYWISCTFAAMGFLMLVTFCGWWYQRRLRGIFREMVRTIDSDGTRKTL